MAQVKIPCVIMRGGTSKGLFFKDEDLPKEREARERLLLAAFGSPDERQIDGLGGAHPLTSKCAIVAPTDRPGIDVDYTFAQVAIDRPVVDWRGNCGNIASAVGLFAVQEGWVESREPASVVRVLNTNTGKSLEVHVPVRGGAPDEEGETSISGVPGFGPAIRLVFLEPSGAVTGALLPTGRVVDELEVGGLGRVQISVVDAANPLLFLQAQDIGWTGAESAAEIDSSTETLFLLERLRGEVARRLGFLTDPARSAQVSPAVPKMAVVAPAGDYNDALGQKVAADAHDIRIRMLSMGRAHKACALTGAVCTAAAAHVDGSIVNRVVREGAGQSPRSSIRIGHPAGIVEVGVKVHAGVCESASVDRTARRLMEGFVYVTASSA
jgi:2-methylaconitate cis-trans-isomerase PrpF